MKKLISIVFLLFPLNLFGEWVLQNSGVYSTLYEVYFVDTLHGWIAGGSENGKGLILRTSNGGINWEKVYGDSTSSDMELVFTEVEFADSVEGWVGGYEYWDDYPYTSYAWPVLLHTTDGGNTWGSKEKAGNPGKFHHLQYTPVWDEERVEDICIIDSTYGLYMRNWNWTSTGGEPTSKVKINSLDGTHSWSYNGGWFSTTCGIRICFVDSLRGWLLIRNLTYSNENNLLFYTEKGIESLSVICTLPHFGHGWLVMYADMDFVDTLHGWIVGDTNIVRHTVDGGHTWVTQSIPVTSKLNAVDFLDLLNGWVVGTGGVILRTRDGGQNWEIESSPVSVNLNKVCFVDSSHGWAVGDSGKILHYTTVGVEEERFFAGAQNDRLEVEPNPFSSVVSIKYLVVREKNISLRIYDVVGKLIEVLVDGKMQQGYYEIEWNAKGLPSGIYFANLITTNYKTTKKTYSHSLRATRRASGFVLNNSILP